MNYLFACARDCVVQLRQGVCLAEHLEGPRLMPRSGYERRTVRSLVARGWLSFDPQEGTTTLKPHARRFARMAVAALARRESPALVPDDAAVDDCAVPA